MAACSRQDSESGALTVGVESPPDFRTPSLSAGVGQGGGVEGVGETRRRGCSARWWAVEVVAARLLWGVGDDFLLSLECLGGETLGVEVGALCLGLDGHKVGVGPFSLGVWPFSLGLGGHGVGVRPRSLGVWPFSLGLAGRGVEVGPLSLGTWPFSLGLGGRGVGVGPLGVLRCVTSVTDT